MSENDKQQQATNLIKEVAEVVAEEKVSELKQDVKSFKDSIDKLADLQVKSVESQNVLNENLTNFVKSNEEIKSLNSKRNFNVSLEGNNKIEENISSIQEQEVKSLLENTTARRDIKIKSLGERKSNSYNTFNDVDGGLSVARPTFSGTYDSNRIVYAPILSLSKKIIGDFNGASYVGIDNSKLALYENPELTQTEKENLIKLSQIDIIPKQVSAYVGVSSHIYDLGRSNAVNFDIVKLHQEQLSLKLDRIANNKAFNVLKDAITKETISTYTTKNETGKFVLSDIFDLINELKPYYLANAVFITNSSTLTTISKQVGDDGQYIWRDIFINTGPNTGKIVTPHGTINVLSISNKSDIKFDEIGAGNIIGVFADFNELIYSIFDGKYRMMHILTESLISQGIYKLYERTNFGVGIVNSESGIAVKVKS